MIDCPALSISLTNSCIWPALNGWIKQGETSTNIRQAKAYKMSNLTLNIYLCQILSNWNIKKKEEEMFWLTLSMIHDNTFLGERWLV